MAIKIPARNYLTFAELRDRWECSENDLSYAIVSGELKPSIRLIGKHRCLSWEVNPMGDWEASDWGPGNLGYALEVEVRGWRYLQDPYQTEPFDCQFRFVSDDREADKSEVPFSIWHALPSPMKLEDVKITSVFLLEEVARFETKHGDENQDEKSKRPLATRERDTLLKLVIGMAIKGYSHDPAASKSNAPKDIADDLAELGMTITDDTVRKYLKQAADTVLPAKQRQP